MDPYSLPSLGQSNVGNSNTNSAASTLAWLTQPYQLNSSGTLPGATTINVGENVQISGANGSIIVNDPTTQVENISIDGKTDAIIITNPSDGSKLGMGLIPGTTDFGFFVIDGSGNILMKIVKSTLYSYDPSTGLNVMQILQLPDSTYGWAIAAPGNNVSQGY